MIITGHQGDAVLRPGKRKGGSLIRPPVFPWGNWQTFDKLTNGPLLPLTLSRSYDESGREDLNLRPPGPEPGALARLSHAPKEKLNHFNMRQEGVLARCFRGLQRAWRRELIPLTFSGNYLAFGVRSVATMRSIYIAMVFECATLRRNGPGS